MATEYWRWKEYTWKDPDKDWKKASILTAGIDIGSVSSQAVILTDGELYAYSNLRTGSDSPDSARKAMRTAMEETGMEQDNIQYIVGTGYGRVNVPMANRTLTEIACHARGANRMGGSAIRTILDMGGQDCKVIRCDERGKVTDFLMNDKCAAGTGRGMELIADLLAIPIEQVGPVSLSIDKEPPAVSSFCVVFAKTEALGLLRAGWTTAEVLAAFCDGMAHRVINLIQRIGLEEKFVITGGIAKNSGIVKRLAEALKVEAEVLSPDPQIAGAYGAAIFAKDLYEKSRKK